MWLLPTIPRLPPEQLHFRLLLPHLSGQLGALGLESLNTRQTKGGVWTSPLPEPSEDI